MCVRVLVLHQVRQWRAALLAEADEGVDRSGKGLRRFSIVWVRGPAAQKIAFFNASGDLVFSQLDEEALHGPRQRRHRPLRQLLVGNAVEVHLLAVCAQGYR